jgi:hypothetical protein
VKLSDVIIQNPDVESFDSLVAAIRRRAGAGECLLEFDVKPDYRDTPRNWQWQLEAAFCGRVDDV